VNKVKASLIFGLFYTAVVAVFIAIFNLSFESVYMVNEWDGSGRVMYIIFLSVFCSLGYQAGDK
jgi:hypothetical protein